MKHLLLCVCLAALLTGCDSSSGPSPIDKLLGRATPTPVPTPTPTPVAEKKAGTWMFDKNRGNPLDQKAKTTR
jgi:hypothetical protein